MKKKVLFVTNAMGRAGAERTLIALFEKFDKQKYDVSMLSIIPRGDFFASVPEGVTILNKKFEAKSFTGSGTLFFRMGMVIKAFFKRFYLIRHLPYILKVLFCLIKNRKFSFDKFSWHALAQAAPRFNEEFDLAVAYIEGASTYYVSDYVKAKHKVSFVHIDYNMSGYVKEIDRPYYQKMDRIFCVSSVVKSSILTCFPEFENKTDIYQNTISDQYILKSADEGIGFTDDFNGLRLLTVGRLHYQKGYDVAIKALALFFERSDINLRWYIVGEGSEQQKLEKMIKQYGLEDRFILLGSKDNPFPFMKECDIYVHATRFEGWSIAIAEAKILKRPIIATNSAGVLDQLSPESSIIINLDEEEIANAILKLASDAQLRARFTEILNEEWKRPNDINKLYSLLDE